MRRREKSQLTNCQECTLSDEGYVPPQLPDQPQHPILWVGQAGGATEDITGVPFTGKAGKMLWRLMKEAGFNKDKQNITNVVGCVPPEDRKPTDFEVNCCHNRLYSEIHQTQPQLIIALGDIASKALTGNRTILKIRGQFLPLLPHFDYDCQVLCCLHPSFVMRQRQWIDTCVEDFMLVSKYLTGGSIQITSEKPHFILDPTPSELVEYLSKDTVIAFDTETTGLNPRRDEIIGLSLSNGNGAVAVDFYERGEKFEIVKRFLEDETAKKATQNGSFDCAFLEALGIEVRGLFYDTRLAEHLLNSDLPTDLQFLRKKYTSIEAYKPDRKQMKDVGKLLIQQVKEICCWDALVTKEVMQKQLKLLTEGQLNVLHNIYIPLVFTLNKMEKKGVKVDVNKLALIYARLLPQAEEIREKYFAPLGINPNSPKQLAAYFKLEHTKKFGTRTSQTDPENYIDIMIRRGHPESERLQALLDYRALMKQASTALKGIYDRLEDGYIHTNYHPEGTGTGRISSKNPNLQNVQKPFRCIYIPDDEDHVFIEIDYNQLELAVAAVLGREETLLEQMKRGIKPHHVLGKAIFGREWKDLTELEKLREKAVLFGTLGGRSPYSISREFNVPVDTARRWQEICVTQYPGLLRYINETIDEFTKTGKITTAFGTVRKVSTIPQAMNNRFQGSASFVTLTTLNELHKAGFDLRLTVHDSIVYQCLRKEAIDSVREAKKIVERPIKELDNYCFQAKYHQGDNWYELEEVEV